MSPRKTGLLWDAAVLLTVAVVFIILTGGKWTHPVNDFGREVYIPWAIDQGAVLYKDLAYLFGALPPCLNALLFKFFGASLQTIQQFDLLVVALMTALIYRFFYLVWCRLSALAAAASFLVLFAFDYLPFGSNMYYLSPYSHSYFYAGLFTLAIFNTLEKYFKDQRKRWLLLTGVLLGAALLSRLELFIIIFIASMFGLVIDACAKNMALRERFRNWMLVLAGVTIAVLPFLIYFSMHMPVSKALMSIVGFNPQWQQVSGIYLYRNLAGLIHVPMNLQMLGIVLGAYAALYLGLNALGQAFLLRRAGRDHFQVFVLGAYFFTVYGAVLYAVNHGWAHEIFRGAAVCVILAGILAYRKMRQAQDADSRTRALLMLMFCLFAGLMLFKVPLSMKLFNYALFYGMPAGLVTVIVWVKVVPQIMQERYKSGAVSQLFVLFLLVSVGIQVFGASIHGLGARQKKVGLGPNALWALDRTSPWGAGDDVDLFLKWAKENLKAGERFVVLPEGIMLNFLTGHKISGRHLTFMPAEMVTFGEKSMLGALTEDPPEYMVLVHKSNAEYGGIVLGQNYALEIVGWLKEHYQRVWISREKRPGNFSIEVYQRRS